MTRVLSPEQFGSLFESFKESAFRLEALDLYTVPQELSEYQRYLAGELLPTTSESEWVEFVKKSVGEKKAIQRVHIVSLPLTPYLKYEIEWGYIFTSVAGEDIYLLDRARLVQGHLLGLKDFWLFDLKTLVIVHYDSEGRFLRGERQDSAEVIQKHIQISTELLSQSTPLKSFLAQMRGA